MLFRDGNLRSLLPTLGLLIWNLLKKAELFVLVVAIAVVVVKY